jgi:nitrogen fixation protein FixH
VTGVLGRPATNRDDAALSLTEAGPGHYVAHAAGVAKGTWLISLEARRQDDTEPIYRSRRRLWLEP